MPRESRYPTLYNELESLTISDLKKLNMLPRDPEDPEYKGGVFCSGENKKVKGFWITAKIDGNNSFIEFDYHYRGTNYNYQIRLVNVESNLGKGTIWYFLCPTLNKRCRKLYFFNGRYKHRQACVGCFYRSQTESKFQRSISKWWSIGPLRDQLLFQKHLKRNYAGKPTKSYLRLLKKLLNAKKNAAVGMAISAAKFLKRKRL